DSVLTVGVYVSPTSPGPTVPPNVNVSVCATGAVFGVVTAAADGPSLLAEVGADVPANAIVKVPSPVSDWMSNWAAWFGSATAVTAPLTVTLALIAVTRASRTAVALARGPVTVIGVPLIVMVAVSAPVGRATTWTPSSWPEPLPARIAVKGVPAASATIWNVLPTTLLPVTIELMPPVPLLDAPRADAA